MTRIFDVEHCDCFSVVAGRGFSMLRW